MKTCSLFLLVLTGSILLALAPAVAAGRHGACVYGPGGTPNEDWVLVDFTVGVNRKVYDVAVHGASDSDFADRAVGCLALKDAILGPEEVVRFAASAGLPGGDLSVHDLASHPKYQVLRLDPPLNREINKGVDVRRPKSMLIATRAEGDIVLRIEWSPEQEPVMEALHSTSSALEEAYKLWAAENLDISFDGEPRPVVIFFHGHVQGGEVTSLIESHYIPRP